MRIAIVVLGLSACGGGGGGDDGDAMPISGSCDTDPLKTGLVAQQTGVNVDSFDCQILKWTAQYNEPDPMIFKAIIYVESRFDYKSIGCTNVPCGMPSGWNVMESGCLGLMQIVPACNGTPGSVGLLPNGHPNMETDMTASDWTTSIFYPDVNVDVGIFGVSGNRAREKMKYAGCTEEQYTLMAVGDYNSYGSTKSCTEYNTAYDDPMLDAYKMYSIAASYTQHPYPYP